MVIRRPRINHPTDQFLVYVGDKEAEEAAAQARRQWLLGPFEPTIREVHHSFYSSFPEDPAWTVYIAIENVIFRGVPHMRSAIMHKPFNKALFLEGVGWGGVLLTSPSLGFAISHIFRNPRWRPVGPWLFSESTNSIEGVYTTQWYRYKHKQL